MGRFSSELPDEILITLFAIFMIIISIRIIMSITNTDTVDLKIKQDRIKGKVL